MRLLIASRFQFPGRGKNPYILPLSLTCTESPLVHVDVETSKIWCNIVLVLKLLPLILIKWTRASHIQSPENHDIITGSNGELVEVEKHQYRCEVHPYDTFHILLRGCENHQCTAGDEFDVSRAKLEGCLIDPNYHLKKWGRLIILNSISTLSTT